jgi:hypothetical protein
MKADGRYDTASESRGNECSHEKDQAIRIPFTSIEMQTTYLLLKPTEAVNECLGEITHLYVQRGGS